MRVGMFMRPKRERTYLGSKKVKIKVKKKIKIPFCIDVSYLFGKVYLKGKRY
jgi:hypothetical protein